MKRSPASILVAAALAGAGTMTVELAAVRLLAPWFGTSAGVWTNVIGVILLALAVGYLAGSRLAARARPLRSMGLMLVAAAAFTAVLPALAGPVCGLFLPEGMSLHQAAGLWLWGSLAATLLLFFPPAFFLGGVGPLAVELVQVRERSHAGTAGGQVLCVSTLGSLAGTFATTHLLLPALGIRVTFLGAAALLLATGLALAIAAGREAGGAQGSGGLGAGTGALLLLLTLAGGAGAALPLRAPPLPEGLRVLAAAESPYQSLRVVEDTRWGEPWRMLQVNEGTDSFQSVWREAPGLLGAGMYYDYFALPAWWAGAEGEWKVLVLGLGAGTTFRVLAGASPEGVELDLWGVEIDAAAVDLGRAWFDLPPDSERVHVIAGADARAALPLLPTDFDLIVLDAYANQVEIPPHLATTELFAELAEHLTERGWVAVNVGGFGRDDPVVGAVGSTLSRVFGPDRTAGARVPRSRNWVLYARRGAPLPEPGDAAWSAAGPVGEALLPPLRLPGAWAHFDPAAGPILTDDRSPMEQLQLRSLEEGRDRLASSP
jgi:spermidine synthase